MALFIRPPGSVTVTERSYYVSIPFHSIYLKISPLLMFCFRREISELSRRIATKLCHMMRIGLCFIIWVYNLGTLPPKRNVSQIRAKFSAISVNCSLWSRASPKRITLSAIAKWRYQPKFLQHLWFGPLGLIKSYRRCFWPTLNKGCARFRRTIDFDKSSKN